MSVETSVIYINFDPSVTGLAAAVGERAKNTATGDIWVKQGTGNTQWILGTLAYGGGGGGASTADAFVTIGHPADLTGERALTASATIDITDGGANGAVTPSLNVAGAAAALAASFDAAGAAAARAPSTADYLVRTADAGLSAERVVTDTGTITWDWSVAGQAKANAVGASVTFTEVEKDLGSTPVLSGHFDITGLAGLTINKQVIVQQKAAAYTGKGSLFDEMEMDQIVAGGYVSAADTIRVYWRSTGPVMGNCKFGYLVST